MKAPFLAVPIFGLQNSVWQSLSMVAFGMAAKNVVAFQRRTQNIGILKYPETLPEIALKPHVYAE
jgi:hypothetical protein